MRHSAWLNWIAYQLIVSLLLMLPLSVNAIEIVEFATQEQQNRYRDIIAELRCLVCQNQSLADSNADLAQDMRSVAADMIRNNQDNAAIIQFMTKRYGSFVHYRPSLSGNTLALWLLPFLLLLSVLIGLPSIIRNHKHTPLQADDRQKIVNLLDQD